MSTTITYNLCPEFLSSEMYKPDRGNFDKKLGAEVSEKAGETKKFLYKSSEAFPIIREAFLGKLIGDYMRVELPDFSQYIGTFTKEVPPFFYTTIILAVRKTIGLFGVTQNHSIVISRSDPISSNYLFSLVLKEVNVNLLEKVGPNKETWTDKGIEVVPNKIYNTSILRRQNAVVWSKVEDIGSKIEYLITLLTNMFIQKFEEGEVGPSLVVPEGALPQHDLELLSEYFKIVSMDKDSYESLRSISIVNPTTSRTEINKVNTAEPVKMKTTLKEEQTEEKV